MSKKVKIGNIEIEINGKVIKLKLEEAQELKDILNKTFPDEKTTYVEKYIDRYPYRHWRYNWLAPMSLTAEPPRFEDNTIMCDSSNTLRLSCSTG